ncbi:hypothetical protein COJ07_01090 [Bacillus cereus]|uniref:ATP-grasp domain-containing protein n=1 Tax=Bacillus cereus TaxID=1396 RepID=A0A2B0UA37_BACCE|nr:ATP-grasp domain-containing protein [Bacillus cereus]PFL25305.1 hypothetical protein COJ07_01090 [Bacillus cereus]PFU38523.1 hypothetical protein COK86_25430 [Bacillus cereus]
MESLIFLWDFNLISEYIKKYDSFHRVVVLDKRRKNINLKELEKIYDEVIVVEDANNNILVGDVLEEINKKYKIKAIYATFENFVEVAGYLRTRFNIQGLNEEDSLNVRNKFLMKKVAEKHNIKCAAVEMIKGKESIEKFIENYGFPIIIKPIDGAGTKLTYKIDDVAKLEEVCKLISLYDKKGLYSGNYIIEEFVYGEEYECDSIVQNGEVIFSTVGKYLTNLINTVNSETALGVITYPDKSNDDIVEKIKEFNKKVVKSFNCENTITHLEVFIDKDGEVIFSELAARIGGGPVIGNNIKSIYNVNIYESFVDLEINKIKVDSDEFSQCYAGCITFPYKNGEILEISKEDDFKDISGIVEVKIFNKVGDILGDKDDTSKRTGYIIINDTNLSSLKQKLSDANKNFLLITQN